MLGIELFLIAISSILISVLQFFSFSANDNFTTNFKFADFYFDRFTNKFIDKFDLQKNRVAFISILNEVSDLFEF
ncbi:MAG: hypothetical protein P1P64_02315 [Treponemataceae bacterium]